VTTSSTLAVRAPYPDGVMDPEIPMKAKRRRFTAEYKAAVLREIDAATQPGQVGAILRREGLYSSHLVEWRRARDAGALEALGKVRGRKPVDPVEVENNKLRRENARLAEKLSRAQRVIEVQGKVSALLRELSQESAENRDER
jgi:transposase